MHLSPEGAPLIDGDDELDEYPGVQEQFADWVVKGRISQYASLDDFRASVGYLPSGEARFGWLQNHKNITVIYGTGSGNTAEKVVWTEDPAWSNTGYHWYSYVGGTTNTETGMATGPRTLARMQDSGTTIDLHCRVERTAETSFGASDGWYRWGLTSERYAATDANGIGYTAGQGYVYHAATNRTIPCLAQVQTASRIILISAFDGNRIGGGNVGAPGLSWGTGDRIVWNVRYEKG